MELVQQLKQQLKEVWDRFTKLQRIIIGVAAGVVLLAIILFSSIMGKQEYNILFSNLEAQDAAAITERLKENKISYKLRDNGSTIAIAQNLDQVYELRNSFTAEGLPKQGVIGFETIEKLPFGTTDTQLKMLYQKALEGELSRTISHLTGVKNARVHITEAKSSVFVLEEKPAKAAVVVDLKAGYKLDPNAVRGIVHLVANSIENLSPEDVTILDITGNIISNSTSSQAGLNGGNEVTMAQLEIQKGFQKELEQSVQTLLEQVLGPGNVQVRVNAILDFDLREKETRLFEPVIDESGIIRNIEELKETFSGQGQAGGVPGTDSNIPTYPTVDSEGDSSYESQKKTINYEINEIKETFVVSQGSVKRLTVAVVVNGEIDDQKQEAIENTVAASIGLDPNRGDAISVTGMNFDHTLADILREDLEGIETAFPLWLKLLIAGLGGCGLAAFILARRRGKGTNLDLFVGDEVAVSSISSEPVLSAEEMERKHLREEVEKVVKQKTEETVQILRTWLAEE